MSLKNSNDTIVNRTRDLSVCGVQKHETLHIRGLRVNTIPRKSGKIVLNALRRLKSD